MSEVTFWSGAEVGGYYHSQAGGDIHANLIPAETHVPLSTNFQLVMSPELKLSSNTGFGVKGRLGISGCANDGYCFGGVYVHAEKNFGIQNLNYGAGVDIWTSAYIFPGINAEVTYDQFSKSVALFFNVRGVYPILDRLLD